LPNSEQIYPDLAVAILAGGVSRRFGADKALIRLEADQPTLIERTVSIARELSDDICIIGHDRFAALDLGVPIVPDHHPGQGPLEGIATALRHTNRSRMLVLACDMPCLRLSLLRLLVERPSSAEVVSPRTDDGRWHPMHAVYRASALQPIEELLRSGDMAVRLLFDRITVEAVTEEEMRTVDPELISLINVNRPGDLERSIRCQS
jgi:molybdopterin-guanine dinucleotide biosynthesis protein A